MNIASTETSNDSSVSGSACKLAAATSVKAPARTQAVVGNALAAQHVNFFSIVCAALTN